MKLLVLAVCVAVSSAAVARPFQQAAAVAAAPFVAAAKAVSSAASDVSAVVLKSESDVRPDGYVFAYETDNGISASSSGSLKTVDNVETLVVQGTYKYVAPDGTPVQFQYVADENGYQPDSALLPTPPPVPEAIARSLEYIAAHPPKTQ